MTKPKKGICLFKKQTEQTKKTPQIFIFQFTIYVVI